MKNSRNAGRKKKSIAEKRTHKVSFMLNDREFEMYQDLIKILDSSVSKINIKDYIRNCIVSPVLRSKQGK